jgi:hypothetical protein
MQRLDAVADLIEKGVDKTYLNANCDFVVCSVKFKLSQKGSLHYVSSFASDNGIRKS